MMTEKGRAIPTTPTTSVLKNTKKSEISMESRRRVIEMKNSPERDDHFLVMDVELGTSLRQPLDSLIRASVFNLPNPISNGILLVVSSFPLLCLFDQRHQLFFIKNENR